MIKTNPIELTTEEIRTIFDYKDGELWWKERSRKRQMDRPAGWFEQGYRRIKLNRKYYRAHRLVWLWHGRELVDGLIIDHIDNNPANNRIENLQQILHADNLRRRKYVKNSKGGVYFNKPRQKWRAQITRNCKTTYLGYVATREEAVECLKNYHDEQARSDSSTSDGARGETSEALCIN